MAARADLIEVVEYLHETEGDNIDAVDEKTGVTPMIEACRARFSDMSLYLLNHGADNTLLESSRGLSPLHYAASNGDTTLLCNLIERGADVNAQASRRTETPLICATRK